MNNKITSSRNNYSGVEFNKVDYTNSLPLKYTDKQQSFNHNGSTKLMSGHVVNNNEFKHNNMIPYFGAKVTQNVDEFANNSKFEHMSGQRSNFYHKQEVNNNQLTDSFSKNVNNAAYGMPSWKGSVMDRHVVGNKQDGVRPFEQIWSGPGLNQGYTNMPSGGVQQANARDFALPKTVDQLRVKTNPKLNYKSRIISGQHYVPKRGKIGIVQKNRPDTSWEWGFDRLFKTLGAVKKDRSRSNFVIKYNNRKNTGVKNRVGPAGTNSKRVVRPKIKTANKVAVGNDYVRNLGAGDKWSNGYDYGKKNITVKPTIRQVLTKKTRTGNMQADERAGYVLDPNNVAKTTIKETTQDLDHVGIVSGIENAGWVRDPNDIPNTTNKQLTSDMNYFGGAHKDKIGGGYKHANHKAKRTARETTSTEYYNNPKGDQRGGYAIKQMKAVNTNRGMYGNTNYVGVIGSIAKKAMNYITEQMTNITSNKENLLTSRTAGAQGNKCISKESINATTKKENDITNVRVQKRGIVPTKVYNSIPQVRKCTQTKTIDKTIKARNVDNSLVSAYLKNPYTIGVNKWA